MIIISHQIHKSMYKSITKPPFVLSCKLQNRMQNHAFAWRNWSVIYTQDMQDLQNSLESIDHEFRHMLIYFFRRQTHEFSDSQIFFFVFFTLRIFFPTFFAYHNYGSSYIYKLPEKLRKSM